MKNNPFRWCFIGTGWLAGTVADLIVPSGNHEIVSVYSRRYEKCSEFAARYKAKAYDNAADAINDPYVDGVYIVTPHNSHHAYAKLALSAGKPVLLEKPVTVNKKDAGELVELAAEKGVYFAEAMWTWFAPAANTVKTWVDSGRLGRITDVRAAFCVKNEGLAERLTNPETAGGALLDIGIYPITYLYRLFGKPVKIECVGQIEGGIDLWEDVYLTFENGIRGKCSSSIMHECGDEKLVIEGSEGRIDCDHFYRTDKIELACKNGMQEAFEGCGSYLNEFDKAADEIRQGRTESEFVPHSATLDVMEILDECRRQMGLVYPME